MKLKVINRDIAITRTIFFSLPIIGILIKVSDPTVTLIACMGWMLVAPYYLWKNNIRKVYIHENGNYIIKFNWKEIEVPLKETEMITSGLSRGNILKGELCTTFHIKLKQSYGFGNLLKIEYAHKELPFHEPKEIKLIMAVSNCDVHLNPKGK